MTGEVIELTSRGRLIIEARIAGESVYSIAKRFNVTQAEVNRLVDALAVEFDNSYRLRAAVLDLHRLDELIEVFRAKARNGDLGAAAVCIKAMERRSALLGLDTPSMARTRMSVLCAFASTHAVHHNRSIASWLRPRASHSDHTAC
jgi:hypothetical protein